MSAGPDLGAIFDEHVASEFEAKDIDATMRTMVEEPYVWHVPVLTGASGGEEVRQFYSTQFIGHTPAFEFVHGYPRKLTAFAAARGYRCQIVSEIADSYGRQVFEVYRYTK